MGELNSDQWAEAEELFARALELPTGERQDFLTRECRHEEIRREVASLLEHAGSQPLPAGLAIAMAAAAMARDVNPDERLIGTRLGPYRVDAIAGYGGMGAVYRASRVDDEFQQQVAIKLVRAAAESRGAQQRFRQERQILARLSHPNIARLLDGGSTPEGIPYLVMEFIAGEPITAWCEHRGLDLEQRLRIFLPVCEGVESANRELVIHRDLKPANILVTGEGVPKLLDFGIAKLLDRDDQDATQTATNFQAMTPDYASPEQVRGERVTAATDVYALGLILYEILTTQKAQRFPEHTPDTIARVVCQAEPKAPAVLKSHLAGDLDNIIRKAIRKEPERRYQSAADLSADIRRYLEGRPVTARPDTVGYRAGKFLRRNRTAVTAGTVSAVCVGGALALLYWMGEPSRPPRVVRVEQITQTGRVEASAHISTDGARLYFTERTGGRWSLAQVPITGGIPQPMPVALVNPTVLDISPDRSELLISAGNDAGSEMPLWIVPKLGGAARPVGSVRASAGVWSRSGEGIYYIQGSSLFWARLDGSGNRKLAELPEHVEGLREAPIPLADFLRFSRFRRDLNSGTIWGIRADGTGLLPVMPGRGTGIQWPDADYSGDWIGAGRYYVFMSRQGDTYSVWARREGRSPFSFFKNRPVQMYSTTLQVFWCTPSLDGKHIFLAAGQERRELVRYSPARGQFQPFLPGVSGRYVSFSGDQREVAYTTIPSDTLWKSHADGSGRVQLTPPNMRAGRPRWSHDGKFIVFTGTPEGKTTSTFVIPSAGGEPQVVSSSQSERDPSFSPDGKSLLLAHGPTPGSSSRQPGLYVVDLNTKGAQYVPGSSEFLYSSWSPDSRFIAATGEDAKLHLFDFRTRQWSLLADGSGLGYPHWSRDGKYVYYQDLLGGEDQPIFRVRVSDRKTERLMGSRQIPQSNVTGYTFTDLTPDGSPVASVLRSNSDIYALDVELP